MQSTVGIAALYSRKRKQVTLGIVIGHLTLRVNDAVR